MPPRNEAPCFFSTRPLWAGYGNYQGARSALERVTHEKNRRCLAANLGCQDEEPMNTFDEHVR